MNKTYTQIALVVLLIILTSVLRVMNAELHFYNFIPVAAIGLFSGSMLMNKRVAYLVPLTAMLLSDAGLALFTNTQGFYGISQLVNYIALALVTFLGTFLVKRSVINVTGFTLSGSMIFFILSNFGTFLSGYYGFSMQGLAECYLMAIPFYQNEMATTFFLNSLIGDLGFSYLAFGICYLALNRYKVARVN